MQTAWLHRHHHRQCILFFSGWGMDPAPFRFLPAAEHDLCMVFDYRQLHPVDLAAFAGYERVHLVAWSMGVWVAAHLLADRAATFATRTALAGTLVPIDQQCGLPPAGFAAMIDGFNHEVLASFYRSMFDNDEQLARFLASRPQRQLAELREEMVAFRAAFLEHGPGTDIFTRKIVTSRDRVFPGRNQMRAWGKGDCTTTNWSHFPFYHLADWHELLTLP